MELKFEKFIKEELKAGEETVQLISRECKPYIKEVKTNGVTYRGFKSMDNAQKVNSILYRHTTRKARKPRFIPEELHKFMGKYLKKKFGWNPRTQGVFTASEITSRMFGQGGGDRPRAIFPILNYKYILMRNLHLTKMYRFYDVATEEGWFNPDFLEKEGYKKKIIDIMNQYKTSGLKNAVQEQGQTWECIIKCNSYYSLPYVYGHKTLIEIHKQEMY